MECGKLTAKLRDAVPVCFMVNDHEVKRYKNIEIPEEIKHLEYCGFRFDVPETGAITFKIWFDEGILPEVWPATRERQHRAPKASRPENMELQFDVKGADRKTLAAVISTITGIDPVLCWSALPMARSSCNQGFSSQESDQYLLKTG